MVSLLGLAILLAIVSAVLAAVGLLSGFPTLRGRSLPVALQVLVFGLVLAWVALNSGPGWAPSVVLVASIGAIGSTLLLEPFLVFLGRLGLGVASKQPLFIVSHRYASAIIAAWLGLLAAAGGLALGWTVRWIFPHSSV